MTPSDLLALPVERLAPLLDAWLADQPIDQLIGPAAQAARPYVLAALRDEKRTLGTFVPVEAKQALSHALDKRDLLPPGLVNELVQQEAMEQLMSDVLYDAIREFSDKVNPFFSDWGFPGLLKKVLPFGFGAVKSALDGVKGEFDRRLEPEIRRFLAVFSRQALKRGAAFMLQHQNDPAFLRLRHKLLDWLLRQPVADMAALADDVTVQHGHSAAAAIGNAILADATIQARTRNALHAFAAAHAGKTVGEALTL